MIEIRGQDRSIVLAVRVVPRASRDAIDGEHQGALRVRLTAPPVDDRANEALRKLLAGRLHVPVSAVRIVSGGRTRNKRVLISGTTRQQLMEAVE